VRYKVPGTADYREQAWDVPFTGNAAPLEQSSAAMRLAATTSAFSEWLASSPYAGEVNPDALLIYLSGVSDVYGADARPKTLEWMIRKRKAFQASKDEMAQNLPWSWPLIGMRDGTNRTPTGARRHRGGSSRVLRNKPLLAHRSAATVRNYHTPNEPAAQFDVDNPAALARGVRA
jgi:hypothetical protein